jgi:hypothetical protein
MRTRQNFTLLTAIFIENSLLISCSRETHPTTRQTETGSQSSPEEPTSDGPETMQRKGLAANKRPVTGPCVARQD